MKKLISLLFLLTYLTGAYATPKKPALNYPGISSGFYIQRPGFWTNSQPSTATLRLAVLNMLDSSEYLGLDKDRLHLRQIREISGYSADDSSIEVLDAYYTDAVVTYCLDLIKAPEINNWLWYDEVGDKFDRKVKEKILAELLTIQSLSDLRQLVASIQPLNDEYRQLLKELSSQISDQNKINIKKLSMSLAQYRWAHFFDFPKMIVVNIASAHLTYYENSRAELYMKVVVGKPSTKTPRFSAYCNQVILYPYWHVPRSIAVNEILPACKRSPSVIKIMNLEVLNSKGNIVDPRSINWKALSRGNFPYTLRQSTGCDNALGIMKFNITDPFNVYLHDTNNKNAFNSKKRYMSHGCIRIEKPIELANHILPREVNSAFLKACVRQQKPMPLGLDPVPVFVTYMPAEVDSSGQVIYHEDVYGLL